MSKISKSKLQLLVRQFKDQEIVTDGFIVKCNACDSVLKIDEKHQKGEIEQWKIYSDAGLKLSGFALEKFESSLSKSPHVKEFSTNNNPEFRLKTQFTPLVSVDVERSFSKYKLILTDRRQSLTVENIEMLNILYYNNSEENV